VPLLRTKPIVHPHKFVFSIFTGSTGLANGLTVRLQVNQCWDATDEIVQQHPELFSDEPLQMMSTRPDPSRVVDPEDGLLHASR
jgi:hypothetical protein